jgi:asparagine synthase (glutamine-hydrolysing)
VCGFIGKLSYDLINSDSLNKNNERIECRGPDEKKSKGGIFDNLFGNKDNLNFLFIFNRLAIVDLGENSSQPMINKDKNTILMFNGEIFNHKSLRTSMEKEGLKFYSDHSDTEVVLNGLTYYGISFVDKLIGQFAIAFYDSENRKLFMLKDRIGQKPLFYSKSISDLTFGSNLLSVAKESNNLEINKRSYNDYINYGVVPSPNTIFNNVFKLEPGFFAEFKFENNKIISSFKRYWDIKEHISDEKFQEEQFINLLSDSINLREQADVKVANFLSGGIDSSYIVKNMYERGKDVNTFSVVLEDEKYDERKYSREVSKKYQTNHTEIELGIEDFK